MDQPVLEQLKEQRLNIASENICYIVMPDDHESMLVFDNLLDAQSAAKMLSKSVGHTYDIYPSILNPELSLV